MGHIWGTELQEAHLNGTKIGQPHLGDKNLSVLHILLWTAVAQWLRCCATNRKVAGSIPAGVIGIFH